MKVYLVGGAVRDEIIGRDCSDRDFVVVGSTIEEMLSLGYTQVGKDFPVFLHPETQEEYALARTEIKRGKGHTGFEVMFSPDVTIEEDLYRRDLTINAIAKDIKTGEYIDPYGGIQDIENRVLRHTSEFFMDDPLRVFRLFRLKSQLGNTWRIAFTTIKLIGLTNKDIFKEITPERKWKEMEKALKSNNFKDYVVYLNSINQLPELKALKGVEQPKEHHPEGDAFAHTLLCLQLADEQYMTSKVKFAILCHDFGKAITYNKYGNLLGHEEEGVPVVEEFCNRMKVPNGYKEVALLVTKYHLKCHSVLGRGKNKRLKPKSVYNLLEAVNAFKKTSIFCDFLMACKYDAQGRKGFEYTPYPQAYFLLRCVAKINSFNMKDYTQQLIEKGFSGKNLGDQIRIKKVDLIREVSNEKR